MFGPELGTYFGGAVEEPKGDELLTSFLREFLDSIDPVELETRALQHLGGLEGEHSVGSAFLLELKRMAGA